MTRRFQRTIEDFVCQVCGVTVKGDGYTNHCPECLWSLHVDVNPGDRAANCGGRMEPVQLEMRSGARYLLHRCQKCRFERYNKVNDKDSIDAITALIHRAGIRPKGSNRS